MKKVCGVALFFSLAVFSGFEAKADYIDTDTATLQTLDKVTGRTATLNLKIGESASFGTLSIKANVCKTKPPEETPENAVFLEIYNKERRDKEQNRIFSGWMFSSSPALSALENSVYDVWLVKCSGKSLLKEDEKPSEPVNEEEPEVIIEDDSTDDEDTQDTEDNENEATTSEASQNESAESAVTEESLQDENKQEEEPVVVITSDEDKTETEESENDENAEDSEKNETVEEDVSETVEESDIESETDSDTEAETETDTDSETEAETETETNTESETETDSDTDTESETENTTVS